MNIELSSPYLEVWQLQCQVFMAALHDELLLAQIVGNPTSRFWFTEHMLHEHVAGYLEDIAEQGRVSPTKDQLRSFLSGRNWPKGEHAKIARNITARLGSSDFSAEEHYRDAAKVAMGCAKQFYEFGTRYFQDKIDATTVEPTLTGRQPVDPGVPRCDLVNGVSKPLIDFPLPKEHCYCRFLATSFIVFHEVVSHAYVDHIGIRVSKEFNEGWMLYVEKRFWKEFDVGNKLLGMPVALSVKSVNGCIRKALGHVEWLYPHDPIQVRDAEEQPYLDAYDLAHDFGQSVSDSSLRLLTLECLRAAESQIGFDVELLNALREYGNYIEAAKRLEDLVDDMPKGPERPEEWMQERNLACDFVERLNA